MKQKNTAVFLVLFFLVLHLSFSSNEAFALGGLTDVVEEVARDMAGDKDASSTGSETSASAYDPETGITTASQKNPDGSRTITRTDKDGNVISIETVPPPGKGGTQASMTDPKTGITTTSIKNPDGSTTITQTDKEGNVISQETIPPPGEEESYASSYDPNTGVTTTSRKNPDGSRTISESRTWKDDSGNEHTLVTDNRGNQTEVLTSSDGTKKTTRWDASGNETVTTKMTDGTTTVLERTDDGYLAETTTRSDGTIEVKKKDHAGNTLETARAGADGKIITTDTRGVTTETSRSADEKTTTVMTDKDGNQIRTITDEDGNVLYSEETRKRPREPGQEYFENVLGGEYGDWDTLPESAKVQYANSERQLETNERMAALTAEQQASAEREAAELEASRAQQQKELEAKLTAIQREQEEADRRQRELFDRQKLLKEREAAEARMNDYQRQLDEAIARGDGEEVRRIEKEYDEYHDRTMPLFEFTEDEARGVERKQATRDRVVQQITSRARRNAASELEATEELQDLKEMATGVGQYASIGAQMQEETKRTTRMADRELAFARAKQDEIDAMLADPNTTAEEREVLMSMLDMADLQRRGAERLLSDNAKITAAGYAADVASAAATGGTASLISVGVKGAATRVLARETARRVAQVATERGVVELAGAAATRAAAATAERIAGEGAALTVERVLTTDVGAAASSAASSAARRVIGEKGVETVRNVATSAAPKGSAPEGDFVYDLATAEGRQALDTHIERAAAERMEGTAGAQGLASETGMLPRRATTLYDQPGFKDLPQAPTAQGPDVKGYLTQQERAALEARAKAETDAVPAVGKRTGPTGTSIMERPRVPREGATPRSSPARAREGTPATEKLPPAEMPSGAEADGVRETLDAIADEPMRTTTTPK